jgi:hypothetical protein
MLDSYVGRIDDGAVDVADPEPDGGTDAAVDEDDGPVAGDEKDPGPIEGKAPMRTLRSCTTVSPYSLPVHQIEKLALIQAIHRMGGRRGTTNRYLSAA